MKKNTRAHCPYPRGIGEHRHGWLGLVLELCEVVHEALGLHASNPPVVSALQLLTKVNNLGRHIGYPVLKLMELTECFLKRVKSISCVYHVLWGGVERGERYLGRA